MATPYSTYTSTQYPPQVGEAWNGHEMNSNKPYDRRISRTPSPTPSEAAELRRGGMGGLIDWRAMMRPKFWLRKEWIKYYIITAIIVAISALITIFHKQIVDFLKPETTKLHDLRLGFLIPIGVLFVISFPPLFGHEIVAVLCGLVWGLWWGFAIVAAGTFLGEVGNFYAFRYLCAARGEKYEREDIRYASLARVVREGGFRIALIARFSAIPGHFTTAVFSTCGMGIVVFSIAALLSLPKQFVTVYMGVILDQFSGDQKPNLQTKLTEYAVIGVTTLVTILAMWYIMAQMTKVKPQVIYERRKRRQAKLGYGPDAAFDSTSSLTAFNPSASESTIGMGTYQGPLGDSPLEPRQTSGIPVSQGLNAPQPRRTTQQSFDAYVDYGGRPRHMQYAQAPPPMPSIQEQSQAPQRLQPPSSQQQQPTQPTFNPVSPQQTPTQAQFARSPPNAGSQDPELMSPPLPTPSYGAPGGQPQSFAISQGYQPQQSNPYAPQGGIQMSPQMQHGPQQGSYPFTSPQQSQPSYTSAPGSPHIQVQQQQQQQYFVPPTGPPQMSPYSTPPLGAPASPHLTNPYATGPMSPHLNNPYASGPVSPQGTGVGASLGLTRPRHVRDETDASFYTAHSGEGSDYQQSAGVGMALNAPAVGNGPNDPPLSASSAFTNPYQGYMTPPATQDVTRSFSPPPPSYHTNAR